MKPFGLTAMMYHYVRDAGDAAEAGSGIPGLPVAQFVAQVETLAAQHNMIGWPDLREHLTTGRGLPERACLLTFDDGVRDHYLNVYPALRARGLSGVFFALARQPGQGLALGHKIHFLLARLSPAALREALWQRLSPAHQAQYARAEAHYRASRDWPADQIEIEVMKLVLQRDLELEANRLLSDLFAEHVGNEREIADSFYLSDAQIAEMTASGMHFGGHSARHPWLNHVGRERQSEEIEASAAWLGRFEAGPWAFAYPYGGFDAQSPYLLHERGFAAAFTTIEQTTHADPYLIGRLDGEDSTAEIGSPYLGKVASPLSQRERGRG